MYLFISVDDWLVLDLSRPVGVMQRGQRFIDVRICRTDACDHQRVRVATERILQIEALVNMDRVK